MWKEAQYYHEKGRFYGSQVRQVFWLTTHNILNHPANKVMIASLEHDAEVKDLWDVKDEVVIDHVPKLALVDVVHLHTIYGNEKGRKIN